MLKHVMKKPVTWLLLMAALIAAKPTYLLAKAQLAQYLLAQSWQQTLTQHQHNKTSNPIKPWPWLDGHAIAKLAYWPTKHKVEDYPVFNINEPQESLIVLAGMTMRNMAFAPTWWQSSAKPNDTGNTVITAHNDSHFAFLEHVNIGDMFSLTNNKNKIMYYQVTNTEIIDKSQIEVMQYQDDKQLTLITCYPFDGSANKQLRLVVTAKAQVNT